MKFDFKRKVLKNGMTILFEKRDSPVVSVAFAVRGGGINESVDEKGIFHFIEHMLYKGTPKRDAKKIAEEIERKGGDLNGFTSEEITAYWCKMPSKHLDVALEVLGDMVKNPKFDAKELEKERKVIFEELKMHHDNPRSYIFEGILKSLYDGTIAINLAGTLETMNSIDREKMLKKFEEVYTSNNMILCVIGDANFEDVVKFAEENFGTEKGEISKQEFNLKKGVEIEKRKGIDQANLVFAYHVPLANDKKNFAAQVLSTLMAEGMSSRLFSEIREKRNLAYGVKGGSEISKAFAYNFIYVGTTKENVETVKEIILKEFKDVTENLTEEELKQIKEQIIGNHYISMEDSQTQMVNLLISEIEGNAKDFYDFEKNISDVKLEDVKDLAKIKDYSFFALVPE
jgi:predicted Zn-dependent peptidase|tara:strand:- start:360 stop:1559 length:1200 start_codon:yes stop_codon:yes gene_type:complete